MNRTVIVSIVCLMVLGLISCEPLMALGLISYEPREEAPVPVAEPAPAPAVTPDRFTTTVLSQSSTGHVKTALIVDNQTGCIMSMVAPNGPRPMMVDGKWAGCEEQPIPAVVADEGIPAPEAAQ